MRRLLTLGALVFAVGLGGSMPTAYGYAQESKDTKGEREKKPGDSKGETKKKIKFDFSYDYDPLDLRRYARQTPRRIQLKGPVGIGEFYLPPALDNTPGPPLRFWGTGWGASLWRDPVTGRYVK